MALLDVKNLSVRYAPRDHPPHQAVKSASFTIEEGEFVGLVGESGCGKSTLGNAVLQLLSKPASINGGEVWFDGQRIDTMKHEHLRTIRWVQLSTVFQSSMNSLNPVLTVGAQFLDTLNGRSWVGRSGGDALARAADLLAMVDLEARVLSAYPHELSGGMKQRVAMALALALNPKLVILDEPTTGLDVLVQRRILTRLRELQTQFGFAVLFISHDIGSVLEMSDRVMVMLDGEIVEQATPDTLLTSPEHPYSNLLLDAYRVSSGTEAKPQRAHEHEAVLSLVQVSKHYRVGRGKRAETVTALRDISLTLRAHSVTALVGQSGSGKSTIARMLLGMERPDSGQVLLHGADGTDTSVGELGSRALRHYRANVQMVFQDPFSSLNPALSVAYILSRPLLNYGKVPKDAVRPRTLELLEQVGLTPASRFIDKLAHQLSGGQRQRVVIARALAASPTILVADEPVSMLDVSIRAEILDLLRTLVRDNELAMLYITHDLLSARALADEVAVLESGQIVEQGSAGDVIDRSQHPYTRELLAAIPNPFTLLQRAAVEQH